MHLEYLHNGNNAVYLVEAWSKMHVVHRCDLLSPTRPRFRHGIGVDGSTAVPNNWSFSGRGQDWGEEISAGTHAVIGQGLTQLFPWNTP